MKIEKNNTQSFGVVKIKYSEPKRKFLKAMGVKVKKGLTYNNVLFLFAFSNKRAEETIAEVLKGKIVPDSTAKDFIRNYRSDALSHAIPRLIEKIKRKALLIHQSFADNQIYLRLPAAKKR